MAILSPQGGVELFSGRASDQEYRDDKYHQHEAGKNLKAGKQAILGCDDAGYGPTGCANCNC